MSHDEDELGPYFDQSPSTEGFIPTSGRLFLGQLLSPIFWGDHVEWPKSSKNEIFLGDAVIEVANAMDGIREGDASFVEMFDVTKPDQLARIQRSAEWIVIAASNGQFPTKGRLQGQQRFKKASRAIWLEPDSFPRLFWDCIFRPSKADGEPYHLYLQQPQFEIALSAAFFAPTEEIVVGQRFEDDGQRFSQLANRKGPEKRRGRPREWAWDRMMAELVRIAHEDGLDTIRKNQADLVRWAAAWFEERNEGRSPAESGIKKHIRLISQSIDENNQKKANISR